MRNTVWLGLIFVASSAAFAACGGSGGGTGTEGTGDQGTGGNTSTSSSSGTGGAATTSSSSSSTTSSSTSASSSASSSGAALVNGCAPTAAEDHTADSNVMISFPTGGLMYSPACIKISAGSSVTFNGSFTNHPLSPGLDGVPDPTSPITATATGTTATFTFPNAGAFGYYCEAHVLSGMKGAVFVQ